jgi:hypothetical protein
MALPAGFPTVPKPPPASVPLTDPAWDLWHVKLYDYLVRLRAYVDTL